MKFSLAVLAGVSLVLLSVLLEETAGEKCTYKTTCLQRYTSGWWFVRRTRYRYVTCTKTAVCTTDWGSWGSCSETCGGGIRSRINNLECNAAVCDGTKNETDVCNTHSCPVNGGWSAWGAEKCSTCSATCGSPTKTCTKTRTCSNPTPAFNGTDCEGSRTSSRTVSCVAPPCPIHGGWTDWSQWQCNECTNQLCTKSRTCTKPAPQHGGRDCTGVPSEQEYQTCSQPVCHSNGGWSDYSTDWTCGVCSQTCGEGSRTCFINRTCDHPPCQGADKITRIEPCNIAPCPVDGKWSAWYRRECGTCDVTCGDGVKSCEQFRFCNNPAPANGGANCVGDDIKTVQESCNAGMCPVDGGWSEPDPDKMCGACSVTCGQGTKECKRLRYCTNPTPKYGGSDCDGSSVISEIETCIAGTCGAPAPDCRVKCASVANGLHVRFPHETNCNQFYACYNGASFLQTCGVGTFWNDAKQSCDHPENVNCNMCQEGYLNCQRADGGIVCAAPADGCSNGTTEIQMGGSDEEEEDDTLSCTSMYEKIPDNTAECRGYYWCLHKRWIHMPCPTGTSFNTTTGGCESENCTGTPNLPTPCTNGETWADTEDRSCRGYTVCDNNSLKHMKCALGTRYHAGNKTCLNLDEVECPEDPSSDADCEGRRNGETFAHANCNMYNECVHGNLLERPCAPEKPIFNVTLRVCAFPTDSSPCVSTRN